MLKERIAADAVECLERRKPAGDDPLENLGPNPTCTSWNTTERTEVMEREEIRELEREMRKRLAGEVENRLTALGSLADLERAGLIEETGESRGGQPVYVATDRGRAIVAVQELDAFNLFWTLVEAVEDEFGLAHDQAVAFIKEACNAGGMPRRDEEPELVEQLRHVAMLARGPDPEPPPF